ncbi:MAG: leucine-rich repeat domain-containing protein [Rikenellaceae bacterium]
MKKLSFFRKLTSLVACGAIMISIPAMMTSCTEDETVDPSGTTDDDDDDDDDDDVVIDGLVLTADRSDWWGAWEDKTDIIGVINSANVITPISYSSKYDSFVLSAGLLPVTSAEYYHIIYPYAEGFTFTELEDDSSKVSYTYELPYKQYVYYTDGVLDESSLRQNNIMFGTTKEATDLTEGECELALNDVCATVKVTISGLVAGSVIEDVTFSADAISPESAALNITTATGATETVLSDDTLSKIYVYLNDPTVGSDGTLVVYVSVLPQTIAAGTTWTVAVDTADGDAGADATMSITASTMEAGKCYDASVAISAYKQVSYTLSGTSLEDTMSAAGVDYTQVSHLTLSGVITQEDMEFTRTFPVLSYVNLYTATSAEIPAYLYSDDTSGSANPYKDEEKCAASYTLKTFIFPMAFETINGYVFERCTNLESVSLPINLITLNASVFEGCTSLWDVSLPTCVEYIGSWSFESTCVPNLVIPAGVTFMGSGIFSSMKSYNGVESITLMMNPDNVTWNASSSNVFQSVSTDILVQVPSEYLDTYKGLVQLSALSSDQIVGI